jgi:hypothetical protein
MIPTQFRVRHVPVAIAVLESDPGTVIGTCQCGHVETGDSVTDVRAGLADHAENLDT